MILSLLLSAAVASASPVTATEVTIEPPGLSGPLAGTLLAKQERDAPIALIPLFGPQNQDFLISLFAADPGSWPLRNTFRC